MFSFNIIPRDTVFFNLFDEAARILISSADAFRVLLKTDVGRDVQLDAIRRLEHEGDAIMHATLEKLDRTILTPFDREDISLLMRRIDDVIDEVDAASKRFCIYRIPSPTQWLIKQSDVLSESCSILGACIPYLRNLKKPEALRVRLLEIGALEKVGDANHHAAVVELYDQTSDAILAMKWKEIYDITERAIDRCEDIANVMSAIVLKNS
jgi:hypothetical protein